MTAADRLSTLLEGRAYTFLELVALTGLTPAGVTTGLRHLRQEGDLRSKPIHTKANGRPRVIYSMESAA